MTATPPASEARGAKELRGRVVARNISKSFGPTVALSGVSFSAQAGEVHALIGENGAGKSTLVKVLAGALRADSGEILIDGDAYRPAGPLDARKAGVAMVHQELSLCPHLSVAENILLGAEPTWFGILRRSEMKKRAETALALVGDPKHESLIRSETKVSALSPAEQQLVEIARAVSQENCRVVIFDEPTSSLAAAGVRRLFSVIRALCKRGLAVIYISHFLEEVREIAGAFTVMRDGRTVGSGAMASATIPEIVAMMTGRNVTELFPRSAHHPGDTVIELDGLSGLVKPTSASLVLRRGEVLGIAGLVGAGRTELIRAVFGLDPVKSGKINVLGVSGPASPAARLAQVTPVS